MMRILVVVLGVYYALLSVYLLVFPLHFYEHTPGVALTGPYNTHFIRDIGLVFLVSAVGLIRGGLYISREAAVLGAAWPFLHGLYHLQMWFSKGTPLDFVSASDWAGVIIPGMAAFLISVKLGKVSK